MKFLAVTIMVLAFTSGSVFAETVAIIKYVEATIENDLVRMAPAGDVDWASLAPPLSDVEPDSLPREKLYRDLCKVFWK